MICTIEIGGLVPEKKDLKNFLVYFYYFVITSPWRRVLTLESPPLKDDLCQVWLKLALCFGKEVKNVKVTDRRTDRWTTIRLVG
jgi:hypothetical protein